MTYTTVKRSSTPELVMQQILRSIESGALRPGEKLPTEQQLIEMFGVGRSTVREATATLSMMGYLRSVQGKGVFVRDDLDPVKAAGLALEDIQAAATVIDLVEIREILECNGVRLAAGRANPQDLQRIQDAIAGMKHSVGDLNRFTEHDFAFHIALARASGNRMLLEMMKQIVDRVHGVYEKYKPGALFQRDKAVLTAERVGACIASGEGRKAARAMRAHLNLVTAEIKRRLPEMQFHKKNR